MAIRQSAVDIRLASSVKTRLEQMEAALFEADARPHDRDLRAENARLGSELERLRQENEDLRESAEIWIRLYENQLSRANRAAELLAHCAKTLATGASHDEIHAGVTTRAEQRD